MSDLPTALGQAVAAGLALGGGITLVRPVGRLLWDKIVAREAEFEARRKAASDEDARTRAELRSDIERYRKTIDELNARLADVERDVGECKRREARYSVLVDRFQATASSLREELLRVVADLGRVDRDVLGEHDVRLLGQARESVLTVLAHVDSLGERADETARLAVVKSESQRE